MKPSILFFILAPCVSMAGDGDAPPLALELFLGYGETGNTLYNISPAFNGGGGLSWQTNGGHRLVFEIETGPNGDNNETSNTFFGYELERSQINALYGRQWSKFHAHAGPGLATIEEDWRGTGFGSSFEHTRIKRDGLALNLDFDLALTRKTAIQLRASKFMEDSEDPPADGIRFSGKVTTVSLVFRFRFGNQAPKATFF